MEPKRPFLDKRHCEQNMLACFSLQPFKVSIFDFVCFSQMQCKIANLQEMKNGLFEKKRSSGLVCPVSLRTPYKTKDINRQTNYISIFRFHFWNVILNFKFYLSKYIGYSIKRKIYRILLLCDLYHTLRKLFI